MIRGIATVVGIVCIAVGSVRLATASNPPPGLSECGGYGLEKNTGQGGATLWEPNDPPLMCIAPCPSAPAGHSGGTCEPRSKTLPYTNGQPGITITLCACVYDKDGGGHTVQVAVATGWDDWDTTGDVACQPALFDLLPACFASDSACGATEECDREYHWGYQEGSSSRGFRCACQ